MPRQSNNIDPNTLIIGGVAIFGLVVARKILIQFGLLGGRGAAEVQQQLSNPNSPWKPQFYKSAPAGSALLRRSTAETYAKIIYDALNWYADDTAKVNGVFAALATQSQVSFLSDVFRQSYNADLLSYLQEGSDTFPWNGLADDELLKITNLVDRLPQYRVR